MYGIKIEYLLAKNLPQMKVSDLQIYAVDFMSAAYLADIRALVQSDDGTLAGIRGIKSNGARRRWRRIG